MNPQGGMNYRHHKEQSRSVQGFFSGNNRAILTASLNKKFTELRQAATSMYPQTSTAVRFAASSENSDSEASSARGSGKTCRPVRPCSSEKPGLMAPGRTTRPVIRPQERSALSFRTLCGARQCPSIAQTKKWLVSGFRNSDQAIARLFDHEVPHSASAGSICHRTVCRAPDV